MTARTAKKKEWSRVWYKHSRELGCIVCFLDGADPLAGTIEMHHFQNDSGRDISDLATIPLCRAHHSGKHGIHRNKQFPYSNAELHAAHLKRFLKVICKLIPPSHA